MHTHTHADAESDPLGARYRVYQPSRIFLALGMIVGSALLLACAGGIGFCWYNAWSAGFVLPVHTQFGWSWLAVGAGTLFGGLFAYLGWHLLSSSSALWSYRAELRMNGFRVTAKGSCDEVFWSDVEVIRRIARYQSIRGREILGIQLEVKLKNGKCYHFDGASINDFVEFSKILHEVAIQKSMRWEERVER
jgi:hypothetical protein